MASAYSMGVHPSSASWRSAVLIFGSSRTGTDRERLAAIAADTGGCCKNAESPAADRPSSIRSTAGASHGRQGRRDHAGGSARVRMRPCGVVLAEVTGGAWLVACVVGEVQMELNQ